MVYVAGHGKRMMIRVRRKNLHNILNYSRRTLDSAWDSTLLSAVFMPIYVLFGLFFFFLALCMFFFLLCSQVCHNPLTSLVCLCVYSNMIFLTCWNMFIHLRNNLSFMSFKNSVNFIFGQTHESNAVLHCAVWSHCLESASKWCSLTEIVRRKDCGTPLWSRYWWR